MSYSGMAQNTKKLIHYRKLEEIQKGTLEDWMYESRNPSVWMCMPHTKVEVKLGYQYTCTATNTVRDQIKGGYQRQELLNGVFE